MGKVAIVKNDGFWEFMHPNVVKFAMPYFEQELFADAVLTCIRDVAQIIRQYLKDRTGEELDGASLMTRAFSAQNPIIQLADLNTESGRNIQLGYMKIFEGIMIGVRNPKAHENMYPDKRKTIHLLFLISFIYVKLEDVQIIYPPLFNQSDNL